MKTYVDLGLRKRSKLPKKQFPPHAFPSDAHYTAPTDVKLIQDLDFDTALPQRPQLCQAEPARQTQGLYKVKLFRKPRQICPIFHRIVNLPSLDPMMVQLCVVEPPGGPISVVS